MSYIISWTIRTIVLCAGLAAAWFLYGKTIETSRLLEATRRLLEERPQEASRFAKVESTLSTRAADITRIDDYIVKEEEIVNVIARIEKEGSTYAVRVEVPTVEEKRAEVEEKETEEDTVADKKPEDTKDPDKPQGLLKDVMMTIEASGEPLALVKFLYAVEHLPYLMSLSEWDIRVRKPQAARGLVGIAPSDRKVEELQPIGSLTARIIISVHTEQ